MPAYFDICFEIKKSPTAIKDFCDALTDAGFIFKNGNFDFENAAYEKIVAYNQKKLNHNFTATSRTLIVDDYAEMNFTFHDFSGCHLLIGNSKRASAFRAYLIIPEDDFLEYSEDINSFQDAVNSEEAPRKKYDKMDLVKKSALKVWKTTDILTIQTAWELSDVPPRFYRIKKGVPPQCEPFCIIPKSLFREKWNLSCTPVPREGVLIECKENWYHFFSSPWIPCLQDAEEC